MSEEHTMTATFIASPEVLEKLLGMGDEYIIRCADCAHCEHVGELCYCDRLLMYVPPRGFCWMGEGDER